MTLDITVEKLDTKAVEKIEHIISLQPWIGEHHLN